MRTTEGLFTKIFAGNTCIVLILLLAFALRAWGIQTQSLTTDELYELRLVGQDISAIVGDRDGFPPLYQILLCGWMNVFRADLAARWLSVIVGLATIVVIWRLGCNVGGAKVGAWAALLLAVSPFHIYYSQEARVYCLYFLLAAAALWLFFRALETDRPIFWVLFAAVSLVGIYTHYYFAVLLVLVATICVAEQGRTAWKNALAAFAAVAVLGIPVLGLLRNDLDFQSTGVLQPGFNVVAFAYTHLTFITGFTVGPSLRDLHVMTTAEAIREILPWAAAIGLACAVLAYYGFLALRSGPWMWRLFVLAVLHVAGVGIAGEIVGVGFNVRYVVWALIPLLIWVAAGISLAPRRLPVMASLLVLIVVCGCALVNRHCVDRYKNEDVKALAAYLQASAARQAPILVMVEYMHHPVRYYLDDTWQVDPIPRIGSDDESLREALEFVANKTRRERAWWFVCTREFHGDPLGRLRTRLLDEGRISHRATFAGVDLYRSTNSNGPAAAAIGGAANTDNKVKSTSTARLER